MKHLEHFHELKSLTRKQKFFLLSLLPVYFMVIGLFLQPIRVVPRKDSPFVPGMG